jgi:hypothetical protein
MDCGVCGKDTLRDTPLVLSNDVLYHDACFDTLKKGAQDDDQ